MVRNIESVRAAAAARELAQRPAVHFQPPDALLAKVADRQPRAVRANGDSEDESAGVRDLIDALAIGADAIDLPRFTAGVEVAVRVVGNALGVVETFAEDAG